MIRFLLRGAAALAVLLALWIAFGASETVQRRAPQLSDVARRWLPKLAAVHRADLDCAGCPLPKYDECSTETWSLCQWRCLVGDERVRSLEGMLTINDLVQEIGPYAGRTMPPLPCDGTQPAEVKLSSAKCEHWYGDCEFHCDFCDEQPFQGSARYAAKVSYYLVGEKKPDKPPLLFITGDRSTKDTVDPLFIQRLSRDFQILMIDTPGIGNSIVHRIDDGGAAHPFRLFTLEAQAQVVHDFLQQLLAAGEIDRPPVVMANAAGGRVAGYLIARPDALAYPDLILVASHITGASGGGDPEKIAAVTSQAYDCCNLRNLNYTSPCDAEGQQSKRRFMQRAARIALLGGWPESCDRLAQTYGVMVMDGVREPIRGLDATTMPVLFIQGSGDNIASPCHALCLREILTRREPNRQVELLIVDGGHTPQFGASVEAVAAGIDAFVAGRELSPGRERRDWAWMSQYCEGEPCALDAHTAGGRPHCDADKQLLDCQPYLDRVGTLPQCGTCASDINLDGSVGVKDLAALAFLWNNPFTRCQPLPYADLNADNRVDRADAALLVRDWGACPSPQR